MLLKRVFRLTSARKFAPVSTFFPNDAKPLRPRRFSILACRFASHVSTINRTWESIKQIMGPGALDPLTKELIYIAVSVTNNCNYCIASHTASAFGKGMTDAMFKELQAIIGMANETNKLVTGYQVEVDQRFQPPLPR